MDLSAELIRKHRAIVEAAVKSHTRHSKKGKTFTVKAFDRKSGLPGHEEVEKTKTVTDGGKSFHTISVRSKFLLGKGSKRSQELLAKKAHLEKAGWTVDHGTKGGDKHTRFNSPWGHSADQAQKEFDAAGQKQKKRQAREWRAGMKKWARTGWRGKY